jgi:hypothetical protein
MSDKIDCPFEEEVLAAAVQSRWPDRVDAALRAHAAGCAICSDLAAASTAIGDAQGEIRGLVTVPDSGRVWCVAQMRARREALKAAGRPITAAHVIGLACVAGLLGACFGATSVWFQSALRWIASSTALLPSATALVVQHGIVAAGAAVVIFVVPAAVYLAMGKD